MNLPKFVSQLPLMLQFFGVKKLKKLLQFERNKKIIFEIKGIKAAFLRKSESELE